MHLSPPGFMGHSHAWAWAAIAIAATLGVFHLKVSRPRTLNPDQRVYPIKSWTSNELEHSKAFSGKEDTQHQATLVLDSRPTPARGQVPRGNDRVGSFPEIP
jgi:hypothetical protein